MNKIKDPYVKLAKETVEEYTKTGNLPTLEEIDKELLNNKSGAFVSLKKNGQLRGCIGTIEAVYDNLGEEIIHNAISACSRDPRFTPVREDELDDLVYSVDVLGPAEPISSLEELDPKKYGVIVSRDYRKGLLLPDLEGVDTIEEQLGIACQKAGILPNEPINVERFEVIRHVE